MRLPRPGQLVEIHWPGGPYDFKIRFESAERSARPGWEGWVTLYGMVVEPEGPQHWGRHGFYVRRAGDQWRMLPRGPKLQQPGPELEAANRKAIAANRAAWERLRAQRNG